MQHRNHHRLTLYATIFLWSVLAQPSTMKASNWPGWRGPNGNGVTNERGLPIRWSLTENIRWKVPVRGAGVSTPIIWGNFIFLTASDGRLNDNLHIYCYRLTDGKLLWQTQLFGSAQPEGQFPPGGMAVPTPTTDGDRVFALFGTGDLVCVDFSGKPLWIRSLAEEIGPFRNRWGMGSSPILVKDFLVVQVDHWGQSYLLGVNANTGHNRWRTNRDATVNWSTPAVAQVNGKLQLVVAGTYRIKGYDLEKGKELWAVNGLEMQCIPSPVIDEDIAYAVSGRDGYCFAIRIDRGRGDVTGDHVVWKRKKPKMPYITSPLCYANECYLLEDSQGIGICLDSKTGKERWHQRLGGNYHASPVAADGKVFFASMDGVVSVIQSGTVYRLLGRNQLQEAIVASPAIASGCIVIRGAEHLFCIEGKKSVSDQKSDRRSCDY